MQCDKSRLIDVVEGILFVSGNGVSVKDIAEKLEVEKKEVDKAVEELKTRLAGSGINVITYRDNVQLCSNPEIAEDIATVLNPIREKLLTKAAMETLAIVAYKQPVTRLEIEQIRGGASSDYAMQILMNFKLVEVVGRKDAVGKPLLFGTTDEFLKRFNLNSLEDLPDYEELLERIQVLKQEANDSLYRSTEIIPDEELPDSKERAMAEKAEKEQTEKVDNSTMEEGKQDYSTDENKELDHSPRKEQATSLRKEQYPSSRKDNISSKEESIVVENSEQTPLTEEQTKEVLQNANNQDDDFILQKDQDLL